MKSDVPTCQNCGSNLRKKLVEDDPGCRHTYVMACALCLTEWGGEWVETHPFLEEDRSSAELNVPICQKTTPSNKAIDDSYITKGDDYGQSKMPQYSV